jgi:DNA-directed RNA polymerase specialized sigma24 family protein
MPHSEHAVTGEPGSRLLLGVAATDEAGIEVDVPLGGMSSASARRLRQLLVARYGFDLGIEAWHDAVAYAWEHNDSLAAMANPEGYLFRVGQSSVRKQTRWRRRILLPAVPPDRLPDVEPGLPAALAKLSPHQRLAVLLVHAHGWTHDEAATALEIDVSTLRNHLRRGLLKLRTTLGVDDA